MAQGKRQFVRFGPVGGYRYIEYVDGKPAKSFSESEFQELGKQKYKTRPGSPPLIDKGAQKRWKEQQKATTTAPVSAVEKSKARLKRSGKTKAEIKRGMEKRLEVPAEGYWSGMTERTWAARAQDSHDQIATRGKPGSPGYNAAIIRDPARFPDFPDEELSGFTRDAFKGKGRPNRHARMGVPQAAASEAIWESNYQDSGQWDVNKNNSGSVIDTDLKKGVDVQDVYGGTRNNAVISIGWRNNMESNGIDLWNQAADTDTLNDIAARAGGTPDKAMDSGKTTLIGHVKDQNDPINNNVMGAPRKGQFGQTPGYSEYALDLEDARTKWGTWTKAQVQEMGGGAMDQRGALRLQFPLKKLQQKLGQVGKIESIIDTDVLEAMDEVGIERGIRKPGDVSYHAGFGKTVGKQLRSNWKGGITNLALSGASREVGVKAGIMALVPWLKVVCDLQEQRSCQR